MKQHNLLLLQHPKNDRDLEEPKRQKLVKAARLSRNGIVGINDDKDGSQLHALDDGSTIKQNIITKAKNESRTKKVDECDDYLHAENKRLLKKIDGPKALGLLRAYSTRSAERSIGFFKKHVKSRVSPGENAGNVIKRQLLMRNFNRVYYGDDYLGEEPEKDEYIVPGYPNIELWDLHLSTADNTMLVPLRTYWHSFFDDNRAENAVLDTNIRIGKRLYISGTVYNCNRYPQLERKLSTLVRIFLGISRTQNAHATYFGEVIRFFTHKFQDQEHPLCFLKVYANIKGTKYGTGVRKKIGGAYGNRGENNSNVADKVIVTHVDNIKGYAGMLKSSLVEDRQYMIYPDMIPGEIRVGEIGII